MITDLLATLDGGAGAGQGRLCGMCGVKEIVVECVQPSIPPTSKQEHGQKSENTKPLDRGRMNSGIGFRIRKSSNDDEYTRVSNGEMTVEVNIIIGIRSKYDSIMVQSLEARAAS